MTELEQKVRAQAEEWGAEVYVRPEHERINGKHLVTLYAEQGTRFVARVAAPSGHSLTAFGATEEEAWSDVFKAMQDGIEDCPSYCACRDDD